MVKRQKWTPNEDKALRKTLAKFEESKREGPVRWDAIARALTAAGFTKTPKQCRER